MKTLGVLLLGVIACAAAVQAAPSAKPDWAYAVPGPEDEMPPRKDDGTVYHLPGSKGAFTYSKIQGRKDGSNERIAPADWYPDEHPVMPKLVAEGDNKRGIAACALCHSPGGRGRPQNAALRGQPAAYLAQQLRDMRDDKRMSAEDRKVNAHQMVGFAKGMTEEEIDAAAAYFAALPWTKLVTVVETDTVPRMYSADGMYLPRPGDGREPIGARIIETPTDPARTDLRDPHAGYTAYVPRGAVAKGRALATGGNGKTIACAMCHGDTLHGVGVIPGIAGRSPAYVGRQLYDMQQGARHGDMAHLMKPVVAKLTAEDILNLAAYVASLPAR
jgi:cytochrome c553